MTETETLEVKEIVNLKEDEEGLSSGSDLVTEGQIEATVGDNDVAALVDEAQNICAEEDTPTEEMMDTAEPVTNHEETSETKATAEEPQDEALKEAAAVSQESMEVDDEPSSSEVKEKVTEPEPERISTTPPPSSPPSDAAPEEKSHIPNDGNNNTEDNESNATIPSNTNGDSNNATCDQNSTSTSTQSVLQEEPTPGPLQMPEEVKNSEEAQIPSNCTTTATTTIPSSSSSSSTENMSEVLTTSAPGSCMLKSVVDTTIHDLATSLSLTSSSTSLSPGPGTGPQPNGSQGLPMLVKPPKTDVLLQTAREVLQLRDEPSGVLIGETTDNPGTSKGTLLMFLFRV